MIHAGYQTSRVGSGVGTTKRELILHDSLSFLVLALTTAALFVVTLFLFRSFETHREDLARRWADRGRADLQQGRPAQAVISLRAALSYAPDDYASQLLLAQALADSGEIDQATNYFLNLWEARPGDGFINLELARLARRKGDRVDAIKDYRASIFGDWRGDGSIKRRDVRLELVDYLIEQRDYAAARVELLIAAGNAPNNLHLDGLFAGKLLATGDAADALTYYNKAVADDPHNETALAGAGRIEFGRGNYAEAHKLLQRAIEAEAAKTSPSEELIALEKDAGRLVELSLSRELPARERAEHILEAAKIAQARVNGCAGDDAAAQIQDLQARWKAASDGVKRTALAENAAEQDLLTELIFDTERETAQVCGRPQGDDALLLKLAAASGGKE